MDTSRFIKTIFFLLLFLLITQINSQDYELYTMIGKSINTVVITYGKPIHKDRSNPEMECVFYKTKNTQKSFVANSKGVFQAEGSFCFNDYQKAIRNLKKIISTSINKKYQVDTLNSENYVLYGNDAKVDLSVFENSYSKKYEIKVKAQKSLGVK